MNIRLYQSSSKPSDILLAALLEKTLERDSKALVRSASLASAEALSESLWSGDGFLPHGLANGSDEDSTELQPIWLSYEGKLENAIGADILFLRDSLVPEISDTKSADSEFADIVLLFDKSDKQAVEAMREFWKYLQATDLPHIEEVSFWQQENGKWQEAARKGDKA